MRERQGQCNSWRLYPKRPTFGPPRVHDALTVTVTFMSDTSDENRGGIMHWMTVLSTTTVGLVHLTELLSLSVTTTPFDWNAPPLKETNSPVGLTAVEHKTAPAMHAPEGSKVGPGDVDVASRSRNIRHRGDRLGLVVQQVCDSAVLVDVGFGDRRHVVGNEDLDRLVQAYETQRQRRTL